MEPVGCIYTAQGFEFDYVGVIFGKDLRYDPDSGSWIGDKSQSYDRMGARSAKTEREFLDLVKNTYRVLLTRGMKGCYVYFQDEDTRNFFESRIETTWAVSSGSGRWCCGALRHPLRRFSRTVVVRESSAPLSNASRYALRLFR